MQHSKPPFKLSIIGFGAVGQGVAKVVQNVPQLKVVAIADSKGVALMPDLEDVLARKRAGQPIANSNLTALDVIRTVDHDVVVEVTPTNIDDGEPGLTHLREALKNKRNVVTSNKGPLVAAFGELTHLAQTQGVALRYEATVGGAMPIINLIRDTLAGTRVLDIRGVLNGTCNYILTRMADEALDYDQVLSEAQDMGIAEADPTYDVTGIDTACKVVILANAFFDRKATFTDVNVTGIDRITQDALQLARQRGFVVKLIGDVQELTVAPKLIPLEHPLNVSGTLNAASILTDTAGEITVAGKGAGSIETASAILSDVLSLIRYRDYRIGDFSRS
ncbi:MAG: homoserine dehydrogenase [Halobacteriota archaeon]